MLSFQLLNSHHPPFLFLLDCSITGSFFFSFIFVEIRTQFLHLNLCLVCLGNIQSIIFILEIDSNCPQAQAGGINNYKAGIGKCAVAGTGKSLGGPYSICRHSKWEFEVLCKVNKTVVHGPLGPETFYSLLHTHIFIHLPNIYSI